MGDAGEVGKWSLKSPPGLAMRRSGKWAPALPQRPVAGLVSVSWLPEFPQAL